MCVLFCFWFLLFPPTGCSRADTLRNVHFVLVFTVFCTSLQGSPGGGQEQPFLRLRFSAFVHLHWFLHCFFALSHFSCHHVRFPLVFTVFSGFMTLLLLCWTFVWGGDVNVPYNLIVVDATPRWGGGGMLTFHITCSR